MAAGLSLKLLLLRRGGIALRTSGGSVMFSSHFLKHPAKKTLILRKQPLSPFFHAGQRQLHTAPIQGGLRLRPLHFLVATGGGYAGYRQYEKYKEQQLEKLGQEAQPKIASDWEDENGC